MDKSPVTETPDELLINAEKDIIVIKALLPQKFYPEDLIYGPLCFHATMAIEKLLKSYIISEGRSIEKTHDLDYLCRSATMIDDSFEKITNDIALLNTFVPHIKYGNEVPLSKQNMKDIIKSLNNICNFSPIKAMRDSFKKEHKFEIIDEITTSTL